jgi:Tfp pilus assembly protein PilN
MSQTREINLIPYDVILREKTHGRIRMWTGIILLLIIFLSGVYMLEKRKIGAVEGVIADLSLKKLEIQEKIKKLNILKDKRDRLAKKERVINSLVHKRSLSFLFSELEKSMNNNVWLTSFNFKDDFPLMKSAVQGEDSDESRDSHREAHKVSTLLQGMAKTNKDLGNFLEQLSRSDNFYEVNLRYSREGIYGTRNVVEFEIETYLKHVRKI